MTNQEIIDYVMESPSNTNPTILNQMLDELNVSNVVIIEGTGSSRTMTIGNETFPLNYDAAEDWYPTRNSRLYNRIKSMIPLNMPIFYFKEQESNGIKYTLKDYIIRVQKTGIMIGGEILITSED